MKKIVKTPLTPAAMGRLKIGQEEKDAVCKLLDSPENLFRYQGDRLSESDLLEKEICELTGFKHALVVNSGTSALICGLVGLGIGPGDEVIIPGYTYIATATAVVNVGAVPVIAEIDESLSFDFEDVKSKITPYTKAIIPVHMQGTPCNMDKVNQIADEYNLLVLEDSCQAVGAKYNNEFLGMSSQGTAWSLNFFKTITSGEGGVFLTNDSETFVRASYASDAASPMWASKMYADQSIPAFTRSGYRVSEIISTVARVQLKKLMPMVTYNNSLKKMLMDKLDEPINYKLQETFDMDGDIGASFALIASTAKKAEKLSQLLEKVGLSVGSCYNTGFPDRHIYKYWDSIMGKNSYNDKGYPWKDPSYKGNVEYSLDMCPQLLDILGRTLRVGLGCLFTEQNIIEIAEAINFADQNI